MSETTLKKPWRMLLPLLGFGALCILWSGYWFIADNATKNYIKAEREKFAAQGLILACQNESWGGFPFRFEFTCAGPQLQLPDGRSISAARLFIMAQAYNPMRVIAMLDGPTSAGLPNGEAEEIKHGQMLASAKFSMSSPPEITAEAPGIEHPMLKAGILRISTRPAPEEAIEYAVTVERAHVMPSEKPPFDIDKGTVIGLLVRGMPPAVTSIELTRKDVSLSGKGRVSVDAERRLTGRFAAETNDVKELLAAIDPYIKITENARAGLHAMLAFMGKKAKADFTAENGELHMGPLKLGELTPLY